MRENYTISELCHALGVSRSGYYAWQRRPVSRREKANQQLIESMTEIHAHRHTRAYGSPRMTHALRAAGHQCSRNRVARLMRRQGLRARPRRAFRPRTTQADHAACPSPNLIAQAGTPTAPGTQLVSDITYIPTREGWLYLAIVMDVFSRRILGWKLAERMDASLVTDALERALRRQSISKQAIFHSDRGSQYTAGITRALLAHSGLRQSMSAAGDCYDNAFAESAFASIKSELLADDPVFDSKAHATTAIFDYIETFYNRSRLHGSLGYLSPQTFLQNYFQNLNSALN